jgi:chemotaxis regulatin CheY-phosphate phosphatase CheZ
MNQDVKRDIYDLIAELAKSSNLNLDGTEPTEESAIPVRKPIFQDTFSSESIQKNHTAEQVQSAANPLTQTSESNRLNNPGEEEKIGMDELERLKNAALEELKLAHTALLADLKHQVQHKVDRETNATVSNETGSDYPDNIIIVPHGSHSASINNPGSASPSTHLIQPAVEKSAPNHAHANQPVQFEQMSNHEEDEAFSIDELNRVTAPVEETESAVAQSLENSDPAAEATKKIQEQLSVLSEKIDALKDKNFHIELIREIKQSDERIVQQVNKSHESMLQVFMQRLSQVQTNTGDNVIKWIGIINLIILMIALIVLLFQRLPDNNHVQQLPQKAALPPVKQITPATPSEPQPVIQDPVQTDNASASSGSEVAVDITVKPVQQPGNSGLQKTNNIKSPAQSNTTNARKPETQEVQSLAVEERKANTQVKKAANDEVYFGED